MNAMNGNEWDEWGQPLFMIYHTYAKSPVSAPNDYLNRLNQAQTESDEEAIKKSITKGSPYGDDSWVKSVIKRFSLEQTLRKVGRPKANNSG